MSENYLASRFTCSWPWSTAAVPRPERALELRRQRVRDRKQRLHDTFGARRSTRKLHPVARRQRKEVDVRQVGEQARLVAVDLQQVIPELDHLARRRDAGAGSAVARGADYPLVVKGFKLPQRLTGPLA